MINENEISIIIPTWNRPRYLKRCLTHLNNNFPLSTIRVLILDGSVDHDAALNKEVCKDFPVEYYFFGSLIDSRYRFLTGVERTTSEYICFLADDDILNPEGFFASIDFLRKNPSYVAAHGRYQGAEYPNDDPFAEGVQPTITPMYEESTSIESDNQLERLLTFFGNYRPTYYAVHRRAPLLTGFRDMVPNTDIVESPFSELIPTGIAVMFGKVKLLPELFLIREARGGNYIPPERWVFDASFPMRVQGFRNALRKHLAIEGIAEDGKDHVLNIILAAYLGKYFQLQQMLSILQRELQNQGLTGEQFGAIPQHPAGAAI